MKRCYCSFIVGPRHDQKYWFGVLQKYPVYTHSSERIIVISGLLDLTVRLRSLARVFVCVAVFAVVLNMRLRYRLTKMQNVCSQPYC